MTEYYSRAQRSALIQCREALEEYRVEEKTKALKAMMVKNDTSYKPAALAKYQAQYKPKVEISETMVRRARRNPAGTDKPDFVNPDYVGKIAVCGNKILIRLIVSLTGNLKRARAAARNICNVYGGRGVIIHLRHDPINYDLQIHGASLTDMTIEMYLDKCETAMNLGGWGPSPDHKRWGKAMFVNTLSDPLEWRMSDAHEFGHKLGLCHRKDGGIMDYQARLGGFGTTQFIENDKRRIAKLYSKHTIGKQCVKV